MLQSEFRLRVPARIEQHKQRLDVVSRGDRKKLINALLESLGIFLPHKVVQEDSHRIHPDFFRPAQLLVDLRCIEALSLPHLQLIDGIVRNVIAAHQPWLLLIPGGRFLSAPGRGLRNQNS